MRSTATCEARGVPSALCLLVSDSLEELVAFGDRILQQPVDHATYGSSPMSAVDMREVYYSRAPRPPWGL